MFKNIFTIGAAFFLMQILPAQSLSSKVVNSGGGFSSTSAGSLSFSIGEASVTTYSKPDNILTQGFQQGTSAGSGSGILQISADAVRVNLYPNPASRFIEFSIDAPSASKVDIAVYNVLGEKICDVADITHNGYTYHGINSIADFADGVYFAIVSISDAGQTAAQTFSKSFIIQKQ